MPFPIGLATKCYIPISPLRGCKMRAAVGKGHVCLAIITGKIRISSTSRRAIRGMFHKPFISRTILIDVNVIERD
jgi:hypothetical protein